MWAAGSVGSRGRAATGYTPGCARPRLGEKETGKVVVVGVVVPAAARRAPAGPLRRSAYGCHDGVARTREQVDQDWADELSGLIEHSELSIVTNRSVLE